MMRSEQPLSTGAEVREAVLSALEPIVDRIAAVSPAHDDEALEVLGMAVHDATTCLVQLLPEEDR